MVLVDSLAFTLAPVNKGIVVKTIMRRLQISTSLRECDSTSTKAYSFCGPSPMSRLLNSPQSTWACAPDTSSNWRRGPDNPPSS